jgi:hypothetical protein
VDSERAGVTAILRERQNWLVLIIAATGTSPSLLLTELYFAAVRAGGLVGHWPFLGNPDASAMPDDLQSGSGPFSVLVPLAVHATFALVLAALVVRFSQKERQMYH